jgi:hypothetical protein
LVLWSASITVLSILVFVPVPQYFLLTERAIYDIDPNCSGITPAAGTTVHFHWWSPNSTGFGVVSCGDSNWNPIIQNGTSGSGSFVALGGTYEFGSLCPEGTCWAANVTGSFVGPLLPL